MQQVVRWYCYSFVLFLLNVLRCQKHIRDNVLLFVTDWVFNPLGHRPAAALSLGNPLQREVTVSNDPGIQLQRSIINAKQKFQLTLYFPSLRIQCSCISNRFRFISLKNKGTHKKIASQKCPHLIVGFWGPTDFIKFPV